MKKTILISTFALLTGMSNAQAAFTPLPDGDYQMLITGGCFTFGDCSTQPTTNFIDNSQTVTTTQSEFGSGIGGDGVTGIIDFTYAGGVIAVTSFSQDSYLATAGGTFALEASDTTSMTGSVDNAGNMTFTPTGRKAVAQFFASSLGIQPWNISPNNTINDQWTTGNSINTVANLTGAPLQDTGSGTWNGTMVLASEVGPAWGFFVGTPYTEMYNVSITSLGAAAPRVRVNVSAVGGAVQECSEPGGSSVTYTATIDLFNGGELSSVDWLLDGVIVSSGTNLSFTTYAPLGAHTIEAIATLITGHNGNDSINVNIKDTQRPNLTAEFVDARTHEIITEISENEKRFVEVQILANDICDPAPVTGGTITPVFTVRNEDIIKIKSKKGQISMPSTALNLTATATDASGRHSNTTSSITILSNINHNRVEIDD